MIIFFNLMPQKKKMYKILKHLFGHPYMNNTKKEAVINVWIIFYMNNLILRNEI